MLYDLEPGSSNQYCPWLPAFHAPGTHWYHSHRHPLAAHQVTGGAYGMLIVDETEDQFRTYPEHLQAFFRKEVILQYTSILDKTTNVRTNLLNRQS